MRLVNVDFSTHVLIMGTRSVSGPAVMLEQYEESNPDVVNAFGEDCAQALAEKPFARVLKLFRQRIRSNSQKRDHEPHLRH